MEHGTRQRRWLRSGVLLVMVSLAVGAGLCTAPDAGATPHGTPRPTAVVGARIDSLTVVDAFLPQPASPEVAAIYLTVRNSGSQPDALIGASSVAANSAMLMTENPNGTMGILRLLRIPAHWQASLVPGRDHLMLEQPSHPLTVGEHVLVRLRFWRAGSLTISVPVVPLGSILSHGPS